MKKLIFSFLKILKNLYTPRYPLSICDRSYDKKTNSFKYKLLAFGEQRPISITASEFLENEKLKETIHANDLIKIFSDHQKTQAEKSMFYLSEINRDGTYVLKRGDETLLITGEDFCNKPWLIHETRQMDSYKITSDFYFKAGREIEKNLHRNHERKNNILHIIK